MKNNNEYEEKKKCLKESVNCFFLRTLGISYDEYAELDFDEQQKIISEYHKQKSKPENDNHRVMIGNGEHATFLKVEKGKKVMIGSGSHSCFVEVGLTLEEERIRLNDKLDDVMYSKPVALAKKIVRRIKR